MDQRVRQQLVDWAEKYESPAFVIDDPVQFPRKYTGKSAEISGLITSWLSFGNRKAIVKTAGLLDQEFRNDPYHWVTAMRWMPYRGDFRKLYRFLSYNDLYMLGTRLWAVYQYFGCMESLILHQLYKPPVEVLSDYFNGINGIPDYHKGSACKRICMFLRWMTRGNSPVDMGVWRKVKPDKLVIPLDTHVHRTALELGLTNRKRADMRTAVEITDAMRNVFPDDPLKGDFALFGYGIEHKKERYDSKNKENG